MTPKQLKALRAKAGLSQQQLAKQIGVHRNSLNRWEFGKYPIPLMAEKLLAFLYPPRP